MTRMVVRWIILTIALYATVYAGEQLGLDIRVTDPTKLLIGAIGLGFVNSVIAPTLRALACAVNCLTLGLAGVLINALLFWGLGRLNLGFRIGDGTDGFLAALFGSLVTSVVIGMLSKMTEPDER